MWPKQSWQWNFRLTLQACLGFLRREANFFIVGIWKFHENCKCQKHLNHFLRLFGSVQLNNDLWRNGKNIISFFGKNVKNNLHLFVDAFLSQRSLHSLCSKHFVGDQWFELWWNLINLLLNLLLNWHSRVVNYDRKVLYKIDHGNKYFSITIVLI